MTSFDPTTILFLISLGVRGGPLRPASAGLLFRPRSLDRAPKVELHFSYPGVLVFCLGSPPQFATDPYHAASSGSSFTMPSSSTTTLSSSMGEGGSGATVSESRRDTMMNAECAIMRCIGRTLIPFTCQNRSIVSNDSISPNDGERWSSSQVSLSCTVVGT